MGRKKNRAVRNGFSMDALEGRRLLSGAFAGGNDNAIAYDPTSGNLYAAWYATSSGTLKSNYKDSSGNWHTEQVVDPQSGAGQYVSMALDSNGYPGVAYYYYPTADLRFSRATISGGELSWSSPELADGSGTLSVGKYPSLAFNASSRPAISYYDASHTALRFVSKSGGTTPTWTAVYADGNVNDDVGRYTSLKLNPNTGDWAIAYEMTGTGASESGGALYVERATSGSTSTWGTPARLAKNRQGGGYTSLQYVNGFPSVSFYDSYDANLMFTRRLSTGSWPASPTAVATNNTKAATRISLCRARPARRRHGLFSRTTTLRA